MFLHRKPRVGDYVIMFDITNLAFREKEAYRIIEIGFEIGLLDHNDLHHRTVRLSLFPDFIIGKKYFRLSHSKVKAIVGPSCPHARKAVAFWNECNRV